MAVLIKYALSYNFIEIIACTAALIFCKKKPRLGWDLWIIGSAMSAVYMYANLSESLRTDLPIAKENYYAYALAFIIAVVAFFLIRLISGVSFFESDKRKEL